MIEKRHRDASEAIAADPADHLGQDGLIGSLSRHSARFGWSQPTTCRLGSPQNDLRRPREAREQSQPTACGRAERKLLS